MSSIILKAVLEHSQLNFFFHSLYQLPVIIPLTAAAFPTFLHCLLARALYQTNIDILIPSFKIAF
jgi:hypothetical protein